MADIIPFGGLSKRPDQEIVQDPVEVIQDFLDGLSLDKRQAVAIYGLRALSHELRELSSRGDVIVDGFHIKHMFGYAKGGKEVNGPVSTFKDLKSDPDFKHLGRVEVADGQGEFFAAEIFKPSDQAIERKGEEFKEYLYLADSPKQEPVSPEHRLNPGL